MSQPLTDAAEPTGQKNGREMPATPRSLEQRARRLLAVGSVVTTLGIAISGTVERTAGGIVVVVGWAFIVYGIHAFGRAGS